MIRDGKVLLAWRESDGEYKLSLPGCPAVEGETPEETVARGVRQETGLSVHPITLAGMHFGPDWCAAFNCELLGGKPTGKAEYVDVDEAPAPPRRQRTHAPIPRRPRTRTRKGRRLQHEKRRVLALSL